MAALVASPALAADLVIEEPALIVANSGDWSGIYAGVFAGYGAGTATSVSSVTDEFDASGYLLGGTLGANAQFDSIVFGVEGDIAFSGISGGDVCELNPAFDCAGTVNWLGTLRGRVGFAADDLLVYGTAGIAAAGLDMTVTPVPALSDGEYSDTFVGWTAGIGAELALSETISVKAEYAYVDLGSRTAPEGTLTTTGDTEISANLHTVKLGLNFGF
ncbi:MAG: outer membrane protein [Devosia sp.]